ncbi:MAG: hypothetical protein V1723_02685 [Candidatus Uhrbacteria bacterium]
MIPTSFTVADEGALDNRHAAWYIADVRLRNPLIEGGTMALDRIVYWKSRRPTNRQIRMLLGDFFRGAAGIGWSGKGGRWSVCLPGRPSSPMRRVAPKIAGPDEYFDRERWIEVFPGGSSVDVITRCADDYTNGIAERLADVIARCWDGDRDKG